LSAQPGLTCSSPILLIDDSHRILSGTVAALIPRNPDPASSNWPNAWKEQCLRLITRLEDPYLRILLAHLIDEPWTEILQDESIPLHDRLGIILRFLDDDKVSTLAFTLYAHLIDLFQGHEVSERDS
jgi:hypothetical protein